jgi:PAS domain-containing protein
MASRNSAMRAISAPRQFADDTRSSTRANIRLLILDDSADAERATSALHEAGVDFTSRLVDAEAAFIRELHDFAPSLVIANAALPAFGGRLALEHTRRTHPEIPVIIVSHRVDAEETVGLLKAGASDYVAKDRLSRLGPAVLAALRWEEGRQAQTQREQAIRVSEIRYRRLFESAKDGILILDADTGKIVDVNPFMETLLGYTHEEYLGKSLWEIGAFKDEAANKAAFLELA